MNKKNISIIVILLVVCIIGLYLITQKNTESNVEENFSENEVLVEEVEEIILEGVYVEDPNGTDVFYEFRKDSSIVIGGNIGSEEGIYKSVGKNKVEALLTKLVVYDEDTDDIVITEINELIKIDTTDKNILKCEREYNGELIKFELYKYIEKQ